MPFSAAREASSAHRLGSSGTEWGLSLIHISEPTRRQEKKMPRRESV
ncbi:hypothetical protein FRIG_12930 [Frigoribacterium faeni]|nr:hypothetical protein [Frigoribacterium faeni]MCJ0702025.1 hypothetical protein [Frigoribacterium faeni]